MNNCNFSPHLIKNSSTIKQKTIKYAENVPKYKTEARRTDKINSDSPRNCSLKNDF